MKKIRNHQHRPSPLKIVKGSLCILGNNKKSTRFVSFIRHNGRVAKCNERAKNVFFLPRPATLIVNDKEFEDWNDSDILTNTIGIA